MKSIAVYSFTQRVDRDRGSRWMQLCNFEDFFHLSYIVGKSSELIMRIAM